MTRTETFSIVCPWATVSIYNSRATFNFTKHKLDNTYTICAAVQAPSGSVLVLARFVGGKTWCPPGRQTGVPKTTNGTHHGKEAQQQWRIRAPLAELPYIQPTHFHHKSSCSKKRTSI